MSNEETVTCWACDTTIPKSSKICPNCDMPLEDSADGTEDIDSLLDDLNDKSSEIGTLIPDIPSFDEGNIVQADDELPNIPEFNLDSINEEPLNIIQSNEELPTIPSFDDDMPIIPNFDSGLLEEEQYIENQIEQSSPNTNVPTLDTVEPEIPDFGEDEFPTIPSFDEDDFSSYDDIDETTAIVKGDIINLSGLSTKQKLRIFGPQLTYWSIVFVIISLAGVEIENSNFNLDSFNSDYYNIKTELFLFGWISFLPMGWFYRYKLNQYNVDDKILYGVIYLILQFLFLTIVNGIMFLIVNPGGQLFPITDTNTSVTTVMTTYVYFTWLGFVVTGLTLGFLLFFAGYRFYFTNIYKSTPLSEITN